MTIPLTGAHFCGPVPIVTDRLRKTLVAGPRVHHNAPERKLDLSDAPSYPLFKTNAARGVTRSGMRIITETSETIPYSQRCFVSPAMA